MIQSRRQKIVLILLPFVAAIWALGCGPAVDRAQNRLTYGSQAPALSLPTLDAGRFQLDQTDKTVVLNFWATWCAPCRHEIPELIELSRSEDLTVVGIALDDEVEKIRAFVEENGIPYLIALGDQEIFERFQGYSIPYTLVVGKDQRIREIFRGPVRTAEISKILELVGRPTTGISELEKAAEGPFSDPASDTREDAL